MIRPLPVVMLAMLVTGASAQLNHPYNEVGVYTVPDPVGCETAQVAVAPFTPFTVYVVLTNPYNAELERPVTTVGGFEFSLDVPSSVFVLGAQYPPGCIWMPPPPPDYQSGCPVPVTGGVAVLMTISFMPLTGETVFLLLGPLVTMPPSLPGAMAFADPDDDLSLHVMHPVSGSFEVPVFAINWYGEMSFCETIPARAKSFGGVKALYR
jgi:hypothetical protein